MNIYKYNTKIGKITIGEIDSKISNLYFETDIIPKSAILKETDAIKNAKEQLYSYLDGKLKTFTIDVNPEGTEFMKKVFNTLLEIPYGDTATYKQIATQIGNSKASRAVGMANNKNPIPIFIPCHRVVGSNGELVGYRGGLELKKILLDIERKYKYEICNTKSIPS